MKFKGWIRAIPPTGVTLPLPSAFQYLADFAFGMQDN